MYEEDARAEGEAEILPEPEYAELRKQGQGQRRLFASLHDMAWSNAEQGKLCCLREGLWRFSIEYCDLGWHETSA